MQQKSIILDTNLFIRYFTEDTKSQAERTEQLLKNCKKDQLELPDIAIAEIVWVLLSFYQLSKEKIIEKLEGLLTLENIKMNKNLLAKTIEIFRKYSVSYIDAYLIAYSLQYGNGKFYSFDKKLDKIKEATRLEP